jgi:uridine kinase
MAFNINVVNYNERRTIRSTKIALYDLVKEEDLEKFYAVKVNNRLRELTYEIHYDSTIEFLDLNDSDACSVFERSLRYLFCMAVYELYPELHFRLSYSVSRSILVSPLTIDKFTTEMLTAIKNKMDELIALNLDIVREIVPADDAEPIYKEYGYEDKIEILKYRPESTVHFYKCKNYKNYMYGIMVPSTGYLKNYKILPYSSGIILQYPRSENEGNIPPFIDSPVFGRTLKESYRWGKLIGANSIAKVNESIKEYGDITFANICEARHNRQLAEIGTEIEKNIENIKLICVAGPSSSGKTTFANRLRIELLSRGIKTVRISIDDYYKLRKDIPLGQDGTPDLESIYALNIEQFNIDMLNLIQGNKVTIPHYNFKKGCIEEGPTYHLEEDEIIIIEGIHALNNMLTESITDEQKYRIYIAPQAQIFLDNHNPMSLTDLRLIRRMVRDFKFRNSPAVETLSMWKNVRLGEFKWIYDTQENANYVYNSFLQYELSVLRKYALPLLNAIKRDHEYFPMAERLIRLLKHFVDMDDSVVPNNSLIREFIGGSVYESML